MFEMKFSGFSTQRVIIYGERIPDDFYPKENYLVRALLYNRRRNSNSFILIVGKPRTGKSAFAIKICERIAELEKREFDVDKQLTFDDIKKFLIWSKKAIGSEFILDETGTTLSPDQFWTLQQRIMRRFVQTQGFRMNIIFWILPLIVFIQKNFRFMCDYGVKTFRRQQGIVSIHKISVDELLGKGIIYPMGLTIRFSLPSENVWSRYLDLKKAWNDQNLKDDINYINQIEKPDDWQLMKQKNLELSIQIKEEKLKILQQLPRFDPFYDSNEYV